MTEYSARQRTLASSVEMRGQGLHTGEICSVTLRPAGIDAGIAFVVDGRTISATPGNVNGTQRGTTLSADGVVVHTVEHLLSALAGMWIDNAVIEVSGPELPIGDGSAKPFVELIGRARIAEQDAEARFIDIPDGVYVEAGECRMRAAEADRYTVNVCIDFDHPMIGEQSFGLVVTPESYKKEIAPARTFCTSREIEAILALGLGKGGTEDNVIVVRDHDYSTPLRFPDELVRHKALDVIGDLSLLGGRVRAEVTGIRPSHRLNTGFAAEVEARISGEGARRSS